MKKIKLIILDVGGVFRDSRLAINEGFRRGFRYCNLKYNFDAKDVWYLRGIEKYNNSRNAIAAPFALNKMNKNIRKIICELNAEQILDKIIKCLSDEDYAIIDKIRKTYKEFFNSEEAKRLIKILPKTKEAIDLLYNKYKLAIFTNTSIKTVKRDLKFIDLDKFSKILSEEDITKKKPSGEGILIVCNRLGISPKETAYVGDSDVDIQAAKNAGCLSVAVTCGMGLEVHLKKEKPDFIFKDIYEMAKYFCR